MCSARDDAALPAPGCPIRESTDQRLFNAYPWLFAVVHALLRLLVPRHPPHALNILTVISSGIAPARVIPARTPGLVCVYCVGCCAGLKVRGEQLRGTPAGPFSQNSTACRRQPIQARSTFLVAGCSDVSRRAAIAR